MYDNVEKAISDMQNSRHGHYKSKGGKYSKTCKDYPVTQQVSPIEMSKCMCDMPMDMNMMKMNLMDMSSPIMMDMKSPMGMDMCGCQLPMTGQMMSPQMFMNPVPQCMQELYMAYPYLNPNR